MTLQLTMTSAGSLHAAILHEEVTLGCEPAEDECETVPILFGHTPACMQCKASFMIEKEVVHAFEDKHRPIFQRVSVTRVHTVRLLVTVRVFGVREAEFEQHRLPQARHEVRGIILMHHSSVLLSDQYRFRRVG